MKLNCDFIQICFTMGVVCYKILLGFLKLIYGNWSCHFSFLQENITTHFFTPNLAVFNYIIIFVFILCTLDFYIPKDSNARIHNFDILNPNP